MEIMQFIQYVVATWTKFSFRFEKQFLTKKNPLSTHSFQHSESINIELRILKNGRWRTVTRCYLHTLLLLLLGCLCCHCPILNANNKQNFIFRHFLISFDLIFSVCLYRHGAKSIHRINFALMRSNKTHNFCVCMLE